MHQACYKHKHNSDGAVSNELCSQPLAPSEMDHPICYRTANDRHQVLSAFHARETSLILEFSLSYHKTKTATILAWDAGFGWKFAGKNSERLDRHSLGIIPLKPVAGDL